MDTITLQRIEQAHPKIRKQLLQQYKEANNLLGKNVRLRFAYVFRTPEEQSKLFKQRPKVTNADAWQSIHNYGLAFDTGNFAGWIYDYTAGYPFLVSRLCQLLDEKVCLMPEYASKKAAWTKDGFNAAVRLLLQENNTLIESLIGKLLAYP